MSGILYEESSIWLFLLVSVVMGGSAAWATGKSIAQTWRPLWQVPAYMLALGCAVRFIHFALFEGTLILATILQHFHLRRTKGGEPLHEAQISLHPKGGLRVTIEPRQ